MRIGQASEHVGEPGLRVDIVEFGGGDQRVDRSGAFSPPPTGLPTVPITIAAVGPAMLRLAGRHCDGVRLHAFCTRAYAEQVVVPEIEKGLSQSGRKRQNFEVT